MISGRVVIDSKTKQLVKRIKHGEIAVINHRDLDRISCKLLLEKKIKAVINLNNSVSGRFPNIGPLQLLKKGILIIDNCHPEILEKIKEGNIITIEKNCIKFKGEVIASGDLLTKAQVKRGLLEANKNFDLELEKFINNTLKFACREKDIFLNLHIPDIGVDFSGRHVLVVVRGKDYRRDLQTVGTYIKEMKPFIIAVDGGADACLDIGYKPDIIFGDMDSISDQGLKCGAKLIVHAYPDGNAPGMRRINKLKLTATRIPAPGTSEDVALLMAYDNGAELITAVGTHSSMIDFLEKDRPGMASTILVRLKVGNKLVDAKGLSKIYENRVHQYYWAVIIFALLLPLSIISMFSPQINNYLQLIIYKLNLMLHF